MGDLYGLLLFPSFTVNGFTLLSIGFHLDILFMT